MTHQEASDLLKNEDKLEKKVNSKEKLCNFFFY